MRTYRISEEPAFVRDGGDAPIPGHYEAEFIRDDGARIERYLTDKGRAEILRAMKDGPSTLSQDAFDTHSVEPTIDALLARMDREGGEGA